MDPQQNIAGPSTQHPPSESEERYQEITEAEILDFSRIFSASAEIEKILSTLPSLEVFQTLRAVGLTHNLCVDHWEDTPFPPSPVPKEKSKGTVQAVSWKKNPEYRLLVDERDLLVSKLKDSVDPEDTARYLSLLRSQEKVMATLKRELRGDAPL